MAFTGSRQLQITRMTLKRGRPLSACLSGLCRPSAVPIAERQATQVAALAAPLAMVAQRGFFTGQDRTPSVPVADLGA
jgi:hypothetical protein